MALRWSCELASTSQNLLVDTMAVDYDGNIILLGGRRCLALKRLSDGREAIDHFPRNHKYDFSSAEWNPTNGFRNQFAITYNERIVYAAVGESGLDFLSPLKHHTRQVTDLNWNKREKNLLATASADCTTLIWDPRDSRRPVTILTSVAGVNRVRWNKLTSHLLATANDGDLRIWDIRKGTIPLQYIAAHSNKIHSLDWSQTHEYQIVSSSQDCSVKLFDMTNPRRPESEIQTAGPVWRVSYTPWGEGLMTAIMSSAGEESNLQLWNVSSHSVPVHSFVGPLDIIIETQWRREGGDYQLVTLSRDQSLRVWRIEPFLQRLCGCPETETHSETGSELDSDSHDTEVGTVSSIPKTEQISPTAAVVLGSSFGDGMGSSLMEQGISNLEQEFEYLSSRDFHLPNVSCESIDVASRSCVVTVTLEKHQLSVLITFPPSYPYNAAPSFQVEESSCVDPVLKTKILKVLKQAAQQRVRKNKTCLDSCFSQLVSVLEGTSFQTAEERAVPLGNSPAHVADPASVYSSFHDAYIPYPRFSGARFCSVGMLICFGRASRSVARLEQATPRSLSAATTITFGGNYMGSYPRYVSKSSQDGADSDFSFFLSERQSLSRAFSRGSRTVKLPRTVSIYDASKLFLLHKELAEKYIIDPTDVPNTCASNAAVATAVGRPDLVQVWKLAALATSRSEQGALSWDEHPFSAALVNQLIQHYIRLSDIQTAAILCCICPTLPKESAVSHKDAASSGNSPYHTIHSSDTFLPGYISVSKRSYSWSESVEEGSATISEYLEFANRSKTSPVHNLREVLKRKYADILHMWGLIEARTHVMKLLSGPVEQHLGLEFLLLCQNCRRPVVGSAFCTACLHFSLRCAICRVLVRGASNVCLVCGHGGHAAHMYEWFTTETTCPSACGCNCATETRRAFS